MRSNKAGQVGQESLWDEPLDATLLVSVSPTTRAVARGTRVPRPGRAGVPVEPFDPSGVHRLESEDFAASGWPPGTLMHLRPATRAVRGELVVVREGGRTKIGWFGADRGRPALRTDRGTVWLSERARVVATVRAVEATLVG